MGKVNNLCHETLQIIDYQSSTPDSPELSAGIRHGSDFQRAAVESLGVINLLAHALTFPWTRWQCLVLCRMQLLR